jgi:hypothetical protein
VTANAAVARRTDGHCSRAVPAPARAAELTRGAPYAHIALAELAVVRAARRPYGASAEKPPTAARVGADGRRRR